MTSDGSYPDLSYSSLVLLFNLFDDLLNKLLNSHTSNNLYPARIYD